jgi:hypothetical protein
MSGRLDAFTAAVASLAGCFYALTPLEQQILTVRTGLDGRQALTRSQVAGLLGTTPTAVGRTEQNALGRLRGAARSDGCMSVGPVTPSNELTAFIGGPFGPVEVVTPAPVPGSRATPGAGQPETRLTGTSFAPGLASLDGGGEAGPLWATLMLALLASGAVAALGREVRRSV